MCFYLHFIFIKISSWSHLLLEWFCSLVKLQGLQCPYWNLPIRNLINHENKGQVIFRTGKLSFSRERLIPLYILWRRKDQPTDREVLLKWSGEHTLICRRAASGGDGRGGEQPITLGKINRIGIHRRRHPQNKTYLFILVCALSVLPSVIKEKWFDFAIISIS